MSITVDFTELDGSPVETLGWGSINVTRMLKCAWADRLILAKELVGFTVGGTVHTPDIYTPQGNETLGQTVLANEATIEPIGNYQAAKVTVRYTTDREAIAPPDSTTYVTESLEPATEFITLPYDEENPLYWDNSQTTKVQPAEVPGYLIRMTDWVYTLHQIPIVPAEVLDLPGLVNDAPAYSWALDYTFAAETLLCGNPSMNRTVTSEGVSAWDVTFRFTYRPEGWNVFPSTGVNQSTIKWGTIYTSGGTGLTVYPLANFNGLIQ